MRRNLEAHGTVPAPGSEGRLTVYTDAAVMPGRVCMAYITTHGHYGLKLHPYGTERWTQAHGSTVHELRAVLYALGHVYDEDSRAPVRVMTDSQNAVDFLRRWKQGDQDAMPQGYTTAYRVSGAVPSLVALQRKCARLQVLSFRWVHGHSQDTLNEAADSLAKLGLRYSKGWGEKENAITLARQWAQRALVAHAQRVC